MTSGDVAIIWADICNSPIPPELSPSPDWWNAIISDLTQFEVAGRPPRCLAAICWSYTAATSCLWMSLQELSQAETSPPNANLMPNRMLHARLSDVPAYRASSPSRTKHVPAWLSATRPNMGPTPASCWVVAPDKLVVLSLSEQLNSGGLPIPGHIFHIERGSTLTTILKLASGKLTQL